MSELTNINEKTVAAAFSKQASFFDDLYANDTIIQYKRKRVRDHVLAYLKPTSSILELNAGTGDDAIFFAQLGHTVHATDISDTMQVMLKEKARLNGLQMRVSTELCSYTTLEDLSNKGPFDLIFSNFAGLNCTNELAKVLSSFDALLKPGGFVTLVLLPKFCVWEFSLLFKGKFKTAFRRLNGSRGAKAHIEGEYFRCWYYNPSFIKKNIGSNFEVISLEGLCTFVPPSYLQGFAEMHPTLYRRLVKTEDKWKTKWPWKTIGDYYIITLRKK
ncbi:class I SAM-dependent methyltransferase [Terrimonas alba]|uniref:class I SAM-dependent methyltransferase n=1 Tax=Terrimonas alba TaxID=3349636 RepID=UPI0035F40C35